MSKTIKLFSVNSKMKKSRNKQFQKIVNFTLPAFIAKNGFKTCPMAQACVSGCYARSGAYLFSNVAKKHNANLDATFQDSFVSNVIAELTKNKADLVRIHDSGDFYSLEYLNKWFFIARAMPNVQFYAYTKMIEMLKSQASNMPKNMTIIFSLGGKQDHLIDQKVDRHSKVFETIEQLQAADYVNTSDDDTQALGINGKIGLVFHHAKKFENTAWGRVGVDTASKAA